MPLVSVIIPAYNAEKYLSETVSSVLKQTEKDLEILIIDDCSKDNTKTLAYELAKDDSRITVVENETNMGVAKTRNKGFSIARGKYVALLDSDDVWLEDKLERQIKSAKEKKADLVYCSYSMIDEKGEKVCEDFIVPEVVTYESMLLQNFIGCSTVLLTKETVDKFPFPTDMYHEDFALWLDILKSGKKAVGNVEVLSKYRLLRNSRSAGKLKCAKHRFMIYRKHLHIPLLKSLWLMCNYAFSGFRKYKKV